MSVYEGGCHCGKVKFEVRADIGHVRVCDCSVCIKRGALNFRVPKKDLNILSNWSDLTVYQWGSKTAKDYFCSACGVLPFRQPSLPTNEEIDRGIQAFDGWAINVRCLTGVDIDSLQIEKINGSEI